MLHRLSCDKSVGLIFAFLITEIAAYFKVPVTLCGPIKIH